jgi:hypothetical protein
MFITRGMKILQFAYLIEPVLGQHPELLKEIKVT